MANITRSTIRPQSLYNLVRMLRSKGYVIVGKEKDPTRYTCIECKLVQTARAALNPNNNLKLAAKKASRNAIQAIKEDKRLLVCPVCGHYRFEGGQDHWGIRFDENLLKGVSIPTPEPPKKEAPPEADVKMCASCGKHPIPEGRKKFCLECRPSQKRPVVY
jgi:hypothetical protein